MALKTTRTIKEKYQTVPYYATAVTCVYCADPTAILRTYDSGKAVGLATFCHGCGIRSFFPSLPGAGTRGLENLRRVQRTLLNPQGRMAYIQLLLNYGDLNDPAIEEKIPLERLFAKAWAAYKERLGPVPGEPTPG
mgnify:CR=1 FL=1